MSRRRGLMASHDLASKPIRIENGVEQESLAQGASGANTSEVTLLRWQLPANYGILFTSRTVTGPT